MVVSGFHELLEYFFAYCAIRKGGLVFGPQFNCVLNFGQIWGVSILRWASRKNCVHMSIPVLTDPNCTKSETETVEYGKITSQRKDLSG